MDGDGDGREVEVVEEHRQVVVEAARGVEVEREGAGRHALDGALALRERSRYSDFGIHLA